VRLLTCQLAFILMAQVGLVSVLNSFIFPRTVRDRCELTRARFLGFELGFPFRVFGVGFFFLGWQAK